MKKIGIIGGIGPESTVDYYKRIISVFQKHGIDSAYPDNNLQREPFRAYEHT